MNSEHVHSLSHDFRGRGRSVKGTLMMINDGGRISKALLMAKQSVRNGHVYVTYYTVHDMIQGN